ncbi:hypothetical protein STCU_12036 [Strigomonas culicis]|uniref:Uncharacterized protein n=1 Tax=Strigomonas culicis TaxID=28005 RepID=S9TGD5_9TRYP|nr:hypothetical protein STCU_12036 [Strigomonas culicis]|eukprot:EPY15423.1 hypothetical protein STCU_12036 [Strigomonas culicis]
MFPLLDELQWEQQKAHVYASNREQVRQVVSAARRSQLPETVVTPLAVQRHMHWSAARTDVDKLHNESLLSVRASSVKRGYSLFFSETAPIYTLFEQKGSPNTLKEYSVSSPYVQLPSRLYGIPLRHDTNGFRQLGSYLHKLEAKTEQLGHFFSWWGCG